MLISGVVIMAASSAPQESDKEFEHGTDEFLAKIERDKTIAQRNKLEKEIGEIIQELSISSEQVENHLLGTYGTNTVSELTNAEVEKFHKYVVAYKAQKERVKETPKAEIAVAPVEVPKEAPKEVKPQYTFTQIGTGPMICKGDNGSVYQVDFNKPFCSCPDFTINRRQQSWCKHLEAAKEAGCEVAEITPEMAAETEEQLRRELEEGKEVEEKVKKAKRKRGKETNEEIVSLTVADNEVSLPIQVPAEIIQCEDAALRMIENILGPSPKYADVIESWGDIEEISADVIIALAQYAGIRFTILSKEIETKKMNLGKLFKLIPMKEEKKAQYEALATEMPDTDVVIRCKITAVAGWRDKNGGLRVGFGTKEEHLTPYELRDIVLRGANFIETKCLTKAEKKAISSALPITSDGLLSKIKLRYGW
jgi:hypothetical protein